VRPAAGAAHWAKGIVGLMKQPVAQVRGVLAERMIITTPPETLVPKGTKAPHRPFSSSGPDRCQA
jgi:hypothetical protein